MGGIEPVNMKDCENVQKASVLWNTLYLEPSTGALRARSSRGGVLTNKWGAGAILAITSSAGRLPELNLWEKVFVSVGTGFMPVLIQYVRDGKKKERLPSCAEFKRGFFEYLSGAGVRRPIPVGEYRGPDGAMVALFPKELFVVKLPG